MIPTLFFPIRPHLFLPPSPRMMWKSMPSPCLCPCVKHFFPKLSQREQTSPGMWAQRSSLCGFKCVFSRAHTCLCLAVNIPPSFLLLFCDCASIKDTQIHTEREPLSPSLIAAALPWLSTRTIASSGCESFLPADSNHQLINSWCAGLQKHDCY